MKTKAKKPTKKQIIAELRSLDCTRIHRIASKCGINANDEYNLVEFCKDYAPSAKLYNTVRSIISLRGIDRMNSQSKCFTKSLPVIEVIRGMMKYQIKSGCSSYSKILIEGNANIYWASPVHLHADYNKSRAMPNTERNRKIMSLVNTHLAKHGIK